MKKKLNLFKKPKEKDKEVTSKKYFYLRIILQLTNENSNS